MYCMVVHLRRELKYTCQQMVPTAASPSAQPAIVKIRRVDALIILLPAATPIAARLYAFTALLLLVERADKYLLLATAGARSPRCRRAFATPPPRVRHAAAARSHK